MTERLLVRPTTPGRFEGRLERTDEVVIESSRQPLVDGARRLLGMGFEPEVVLSLRHDGKAFDSITADIGALSQISYEEPDRKPLRMVAYREWKHSIHT